MRTWWGGVLGAFVATAAILARCATTTPAALRNPCDPGGSDMAAVADCGLDAQLARVSETVAAE